MKPTELVRIAESREASGDFEGAYEAWAELNRNYKATAVALRLALAAEKVGRFLEAEEAYYDLMAQDPDDLKPYIGLGGVYRERKQHSAAAYWYRRGAKVGGKAFIWVMAGAHERMAGRDEAAREALNQALELEPDNDEALYELALTYVRRESDYRKAIPLVEAAIASEPSDAGYHAALGVFSSMAGDHDVAIEAINQSLRMEPTAPWTWVHLGDAFFLNDKASEAQDGYQHALGLRPGFAAALTGLARLKLKQGDRTEAISLLRQALDSDKGHFEANFEYGRLLAEDEDTCQEAREHLGRAFSKRATFGATARRKEILKMIDALPKRNNECAPARWREEGVRFCRVRTPPRQSLHAAATLPHA